MELFYTDIRSPGRGIPLNSGRSRRYGSAWAWSLLSYAVSQIYGIALPESSASETGAPFFPAYPEICFSLSHSRSHVLCLISDKPVGADIETRRFLRPSLIEKLATEDELRDFNIFELWVLRESVFKLMGTGNLRRMRFSRENGKIVPPLPGVRVRLYGEIEGCAAAAASLEGSLPDRPKKVAISKLEAPA